MPAHRELETQQIVLSIAADDGVRLAPSIGHAVLPLGKPGPVPPSVGLPKAPAPSANFVNDDGAFALAVTRGGRFGGLLFGKVAVQWLPTDHIKYIFDPEPLSAEQLAQAASDAARPFLGAVGDMAKTLGLK